MYVIQLSLCHYSKCMFIHIKLYKHPVTTAHPFQLLSSLCMLRSGQDMVSLTTCNLSRRDYRFIRFLFRPTLSVNIQGQDNYYNN